MDAKLAYGLLALAAMTALAAAPAAAADPVDVDRCTSDYSPQLPEACVHVVVDPENLFPLDPCVRVWIDGVGGTAPCH